MVVYLDGVMGLNFLVDWLLLLGVNRLAGYPPGMGRTAAAAAVGGGYAGICLVPGLAFLSTAFWRAASLGVMTVTAFGLGRNAWSRGVLFLLLSMAMGGLAISFDAGSFLGLVLCAGVLALLCRMGFRGKCPGRTLLPVTIRHGDRAVDLMALLDTGNTLRDPLTGEPVLVVDASAAERLLGLEQDALKDPVALVRRGDVPGMRLIPCRTVGSGGFLPAMRCDRVEIGGKRTGGLVAFSGERFPTGEYQALTGGQCG